MFDVKVFIKLVSGSFNIKLGVSGFATICAICGTLAWQVDFKCGFGFFFKYFVLSFLAKNRIDTPVNVWFYLQFDFHLKVFFNKQIKPKTTF